MTFAGVATADNVRIPRVTGETRRSDHFPCCQGEALDANLALVDKVSTETWRSPAHGYDLGARHFGR